MRYIATIIILSTIIIASGCKKSPELETDKIPVFKDTVKTIVSSKKVFFSAAFCNLNPADAEECGFDWSKSIGGEKNTVSIGKTSVDTFSIQLAVKLEEGMEYKVRAWIKVGSKKFYSSPTSFFGVIEVVLDLRPVILSLNRKYALLGDTIRIKVRHLLPDVLPTDIYVTIETSYVSCVYADSTEIAFIMPFSSTSGKLNINLFVNNQSASNTAQIENAIPEIKSISRSSIYFNDTVTLRGKFWPEYSNRAIPVFEIWRWEHFEVVSYTNDKVVIKIPEEATCTYLFNVYFLINGPKEVTDHHWINPSLKFTRNGNWKILSRGLPPRKVASTSLNGEAYVSDKPSSSDTVSPFYKYSPKTDSWTVLASMPCRLYDYTSLVTCMGEIYGGFTKTPEQKTNFFKYNIQSNKWFPCANLPGDFTTQGIFTFSTKNKIFAFLFGGKSKWVYDPTLDSWTESYCEVPILKVGSKSFIYNEECYVYRGYSGDVIYKYDFSSDSFIPISIPGMHSTDEFFEINNKFYCTAGCTLYEVNMSNLTLTPVEKLSNYLFQEYWEFNAFILGYGNTAYFLAKDGWIVTFTPDGKK
jgi:hypothetical protein